MSKLIQGRSTWVDQALTEIEEELAENVEG